MRIQNGGWNVTKNEFKEPMPLITWAIIDYACNHHKAQIFDMLLCCFQVLSALQFFFHLTGGPTKNKCVHTCRTFPCYPELIYSGRIFAAIHECSQQPRQYFRCKGYLRSSRLSNRYWDEARILWMSRIQWWTGQVNKRCSYLLTNGPPNLAVLRWSLVSCFIPLLKFEELWNTSVM